jgi:hypothetical protein
MLTVECMTCKEVQCTTHMKPGTDGGGASTTPAADSDNAEPDSLPVMNTITGTYENQCVELHFRLLLANGHTCASSGCCAWLRLQQRNLQHLLPSAVCAPSNRCCPCMLMLPRGRSPVMSTWQAAVTIEDPVGAVQRGTPAGQHELLIYVRSGFQ